MTNGANLLEELPDEERHWKCIRKAILEEAEGRTKELNSVAERDRASRRRRDKSIKETAMCNMAKSGSWAAVSESGSSSTAAKSTSLPAKRKLSKRRPEPEGRLSGREKGGNSLSVEKRLLCTGAVSFLQERGQKNR